jgi:hypothetical protein
MLAYDAPKKTESSARAFMTFFFSRDNPPLEMMNYQTSLYVLVMDARPGVSRKLRTDICTAVRTP